MGVCPWFGVVQLGAVSQALFLGGVLIVVVREQFAGWAQLVVELL